MHILYLKYFVPKIGLASFLALDRTSGLFAMIFSVERPDIIQRGSFLCDCYAKVARKGSSMILMAPP